jgi:hypothetical protein
MQRPNTAVRVGVAVVAIVGAAVSAAAVSAAAAPLVVAPADGRTSWFAGREATLGTVIRGGHAVEGKLVWVLAVASRTLATGAADVRHAAEGETRQDVTVPLPEGRAGVVVEAEFAAALVDAAGMRLGACSRRVRIFPADPFADRTRWLESLGIVVIDPRGDTEKLLASAGVPFASVRADSDVTALESRLIVVGEGTSWAEHPRLPHDLAVVVARGAGVLCLAPGDGAMPLPGTDDEARVVATRLVLRRADVVADLDDRLDARDWSAAGETVVGPLRITADGDAVVVRADAERDGWAWLEAGFVGRDSEAPARGKLVVCGLGIVARWDETPAARFLFAALLDRLAVKTSGAGGEHRNPDSLPPAAPPKEDDR